MKCPNSCEAYDKYEENNDYSGEPYPDFLYCPYCGNKLMDQDNRRTEQEIRERIKFWEDAIKESDGYNQNTTTLMHGKIFTLKWVLGEGADV